MALRFQHSDYELVKFYSYTTVVLDRIYETGHVQTSELDRTGQHLAYFFENLCKEAERIANLSNVNVRFMDNKAAFKIRNKNTGKCIFIGYYDWDYSIGLSCCQHFGRQVEFNGESCTMSDYYPETDKLSELEI